jgi:hypothetical protein
MTKASDQDKDPARAQLRGRLLAIARAVADERGWPWYEPVDVRQKSVADRTWEVRTNITSFGCNIRIVIRETDSEVVEAGFLPR